MPLHEKLRARSTFVGQYIRERHPKGSGKVPASLFKEAHAAFDREHPEHARKNPAVNPEGDYFKDEVESAAMGTVLGLGFFTILCAAIVAGVRRQQASQNCG